MKHGNRKNLDKLISKETGVPVFIADEALSCVAIGTGKVAENVDFLKQAEMGRRRSSRLR